MENGAAVVGPAQECRITIEDRRPDGDWEAEKAVNAVAPRLLPRGPNAAALGGALGRNYGPEAGGALWDELRKLWE